MYSYITQLFAKADDNLLIYGIYYPELVVLSVAIAIFASVVGLHIASQAEKLTNKLYKQLAIATGSVSLGGGIWSMHFIGMLAFSLCTTVMYDWKLTILSMFPGVLASWVAINWIVQRRYQWVQIVVGGVLVGAGIGSMHYMGMAAMQMAPNLRYDLGIFALSIIVAVSLAIVSLSIRFGLEQITKLKLSPFFLNLIAGTVMGFAITGMHYTGMSAARFVRPVGFELSSQTDQISITLALGIVLATVVIAALSFSVNMIFKYREISAKALENEKRILAMMDTAADGIVTINQKGIILGVNNAVEKILGWTSDEVLGKNVKMLMPDPHHSEHDNYLMRYVETEKAHIIGESREAEALHKDGRHVSIRLAIGAKKFRNKFFFVAFITDISKQLSMENALRANELKFRSLIGNIPGIAYRCLQKPEWPMIFISDAVEQITGYPSADFMGNDPKRSYKDIIHPEDLELISAKNIDRREFCYEYRLIRKDGSIRWVLEQGCVVKDETLGDTHVDGFIMDITERKHMESQLESAKHKAESAAAARAAFLANMSHEIRTPMNAVIGFSELLLSSKLNDEQRSHLRTINNSSKSLLHLLNDILDSAKLDQGKMELEYKDFLLLQEVDEVISTCYLQAKEKGLSLELNFSPDLASTYYGAPERIRQVLHNIVGNAIKFTTEGYVRVTVKEESGPDMIGFTIDDSGIGMTSEQLSQIFDPFTQADATMSRRFGGTGLGTTISKDLVELMGGRINVTSEPNQGTTFKIVIPLQISNAELNTTINETITLPPLSVLVADDVQQNLDLISLLLERDGHSVQVAHNGEQALKIMEEDNFDVALMDFQMPVMDGYSAAYQRRAREERLNLPYIPIIALTANVLMENKQEAYEVGMNGFAVKPINIEELYTEIARVLSIDISDSVCSNKKLVNDNKIESNLERGIKLWGSETNYRQQVMRYLRDMPDALDAIEGAIQTKNWAEIYAQGHRGKGVSANLVLVDLQAAFAELEKYAKEEDLEGSESTLNLIKELATNLTSEFAQSNAETDLMSEADAADKEFAPDDILKTLGDLLKAAEHSELNETLLGELQLYQEVYADTEIRKINTAFNDFDFENAASLIKTFIGKMEDKLDD